jgi:aminoglycoside 3-N-acetyltransferase I
MFSLLSEVFETPGPPVSDAYASRVLGRRDFWALAALVGDEVVGGLTAHELPMTRDESTELFLYDLAVSPAWQRQGVASMLVRTLTAQAAAAGIAVTFVPADDDDEHALAFYRSLGATPSAVTIFDLPPG